VALAHAAPAAVTFAATFAVGALPLARDGAAHARAAGSVFTANTVEAKRGAGGISAAVAAPEADRVGTGAAVDEGDAAPSTVAGALGTGLAPVDVAGALAGAFAPPAVPRAPQCAAPATRAPSARAGTRRWRRMPPHANRPLAMTRVVSVDRANPDARVLAEAARVLRGGGLVAFPTETVYGLGAAALDERALARIFAAKGRPAHHPLIAHVLGEGEAKSLARSWPAAASRLARAFWPGPLTLVVDRAPHVPSAIAAGSDSIALRAPSHPVARALLAAFGAPIAAPSANRYQALSPTTAEHVVRQLAGVVDLVLDGGPCDAGIESTVVDVRSEARMLRPGALAASALRAAWPAVAGGSGHADRDAPRASPGMDERHYAPRAPLVVTSSANEAVAAATALAATGARAGVVTYGACGAAVAAAGVLVRDLPADAAGYAHDLYATLHALDAEGVAAIFVQRVPPDDAWCAVADRLSRAAAVA
jgi:L-threonylcarbamoyladenylate synthase